MILKRLLLACSYQPGISTLFAHPFGVVRLVPLGQKKSMFASPEDGSWNHHLVVKFKRRINLSVYLFFGHMRLHSGSLSLLAFCIVEDIRV